MYLQVSRQLYMDLLKFLQRTFYVLSMFTRFLRVPLTRIRSFVYFFTSVLEQELGCVSNLLILVGKLLCVMNKFL